MTKPQILIIDDLEVSLLHLKNQLEKEGYNTLTAGTGKIGITIAETYSPDLILLDIAMPDMNGYDVCRWLKSNSITQDIPIILFSFQDVEEKVEKGLQLGAVDYIKRPFSYSEIVARVRIHLRTKDSFDQLKSENSNLMKIIQAKNDYIGIVLHELLNPLNTIMGFSNFIIRELSKLNNDNHSISSDTLENLQIIHERSSYMNRIVTKLMNLELPNNQNSYNQHSETMVHDIIKSVISHYKNSANEKRIKIYYKHSPGLKLKIDHDYLREIIENLISNAIKFSPYEKKIWIEAIATVKKSVPYLQFTVRDEGNGFTEADKLSLFTKFKKLSSKPTNNEQSIGLGLSIVKKLVDLNSGTIELISNYGNGAKFVVEFKLEIDDSIVEAIYHNAEFEPIN